MKFTINRTSERCTNKFIPILGAKKEKLSHNLPDGRVSIENRWTIEITELAQLLDMVKEGQEVIIGEDIHGSGLYNLEMYDDYRE